MGADSGMASPLLQTSFRGFEANGVGQVTTAHSLLPEKADSSKALSSLKTKGA